MAADVLNLTTTDRVGTLINPGETMPSSVSDAIAQIIQEVSMWFQNEIGRKFKSQSRTEIHSVIEDNQRTFLVEAWPITAITNIWYDPDQDFDTSDLLDGNGDDYQEPSARNGGIIFMNANLRRWPNSLKITYTGGLAADTNTLVSDYPDLAFACEQQVAYMYSRRNDLGASSVSSDAGSVSVRPVTLLPSVKEVLRGYRRYIAG